jgi:hypothetical protein
MCAAGAVFGTVCKLHGELAVFDGSKLQNAGFAHDSRTMDAKKLRGVKLLFQRTHGFSQQVRAVASMQLRIISGSPDPFHILRQHDLNP